MIRYNLPVNMPPFEDREAGTQPTSHEVALVERKPGSRRGPAAEPDHDPHHGWRLSSVPWPAVLVAIAVALPVLRATSASDLTEPEPSTRPGRATRHQLAIDTTSPPPA